MLNLSGVYSTSHVNSSLLWMRLIIIACSTYDATKAQTYVWEIAKIETDGFHSRAEEMEGLDGGASCACAKDPARRYSGFGFNLRRFF